MGSSGGDYILERDAEYKSTNVSEDCRLHFPPNFKVELFPDNWSSTLPNG